MPRWLLAVFVLQLLWNMAGFPAVKIPHEPALAEWTLVTTASTNQHQQDNRGPSTAANGLLDELPDLPDTLLRWSAPKSAPMPAPAHTGWVQIGSPDALLEALFRPPSSA
jgi:hypothetical protein